MSQHKHIVAWHTFIIPTTESWLEKKLEYDKNKSGIDKEKWFVNVYEARCSRNNGVCKTSLKHEFCFTENLINCEIYHTKKIFQGFDS